MFAIQRLEKIEEMLNEKGVVYVNELVNIFEVSEVTIRKDLTKLQALGKAKKTHGGAIKNVDLPKNTTVAQQPESEIKNAKKMLAKKAYEFITKGDTIFIGSGYTGAELAKLIKLSDDVSVITNNLEAAIAIKDNCRTLIVIGGEVFMYNGYTFTNSSNIEDDLKSYNINKAFTSCSAIDHKFGVSVSTEVNHKIFKNVLSHTHSWVLMVDSSKFNQVAPYKVSDIDTIEYILSDYKPEEYKDHDNIILVK